MSNSKKIYQINGGKGGVGKSFCTIALIDFLTEKGEELLLVETDTSNPDVYKIYNEEINSVLINLDEANGWIDLLNLCEQHVDSHIIINTAARNHAGIERYGELLTNTLNDLNRELITLWMINRQRDSLELLKNYKMLVPNSTIHVLRNEYFGEEKKFELYEKSKLKNEIEKIGKTVNFPELADRVSDEIYSKRMTIKNCLVDMPIGNKAELIRWRFSIKKIFETLNF